MVTEQAEKPGESSIVVVSTLVAGLLAIRFLSSIFFAAMNLPSETIALVDQVLEVFEISLPFLLIPVLCFLVLASKSQTNSLLFVSIVVLHSVSLVAWFYYLEILSSLLVRSLFPVLATITVVSGSLLSLGLARHFWRPPLRWQGWAFLGLLTMTPLVFGLRVVADLGLATSPGPSGILQGNWLITIIPTILLALLPMGVWLSLTLNLPSKELRRRWRAFLPFVSLPLAMAGFALRPLSGFIMSALITWGSNLALFSPVLLSLGVALVSATCYASSLILLRRKGNKQGWRLLFLGSVSVFTSGFYLSMASVAGLSVALSVVGIAMSNWQRQRPETVRPA